MEQELSNCPSADGTFLSSTFPNTHSLSANKMTPRHIIIILLITGIGLFSSSLTLGYYKDQKAADNLINNSYNIDKSSYYKKEAALRTNKLTFMDVGSGLTIASITILFFLFWGQIHTWADFKSVKTPNRNVVFILSNIAWLTFIPGTFWYYSFRAGRGDYPPFADSIAIPIFETIPTVLIGLLPLNLFILLTSIKANLPTHLFTKATNNKKIATLWEVYFGFWLILNLLCLACFVADGDHISIPIDLLFTFILLTLRAGQISKYKNTNLMSADNKSV